MKEHVDLLVEEFSRAYCECLVERGHYQSVEGCMDSEGSSITQLRDSPKQRIFTNQDGIACSCVETMWGDKKGFDRQLRWPMQYGEIHSLCPEEGDCLTHRDLFGPSDPVRHLVYDYFPSLVEEEQEPLTIGN